MVSNLDKTITTPSSPLPSWVIGLGGVVVGVLIAVPLHAGSMKGRVVYQGPIPTPEEVKVTRDADFCGKTWREEVVRVDPTTKGLWGAVVSIEGIEAPADPSPSEAIVSNKNCHFSPRVSAVGTGGVLVIRNEDPLLHNTHLYQGRRTLLNVALLPESRDIRKRLKRPGHLLIKCDKHTFMKGYVTVFAHPFYDVTDQEGAFRIPDIPAGTHTLTIWHASLGTRSLQVTVPEEGEVAVSLDYSSFP